MNRVAYSEANETQRLLYYRRRTLELGEGLNVARDTQRGSISQIRCTNEISL